MLLLPTATTILSLITDVVCSVETHADWLDRTPTAVTAGTTNKNITTATTTTIVDHPTSGSPTPTRNVRGISIANTHATNSVNVTVKHDDGTTPATLIRVQLLAGWTLQRSYLKGWRLLDASGVQVEAPLGGRLLRRTVLTSASGTFTTLDATKTLLICGVGGGSGGAGCTSVAAAASAAGGGGAGGYLEKAAAVAGNTGYAYTCGALGAGGVNAAGGNGADSTFVIGAVTYTAKGATGAVVATALTTLSSYPGGVGGTVSTNGDVNSGGASGENGHITVITPVGASGGGASGPYGAGGKPIAAVGNGNNATGFGAGGGGAMTGASANRTGGDGTAGCWVVEEYS